MRSCIDGGASSIGKDQVFGFGCFWEHNYEIEVCVLCWGDVVKWRVYLYVYLVAFVAEIEDVFCFGKKKNIIGGVTDIIFLEVGCKLMDVFSISVFDCL